MAPRPLRDEPNVYTHRGFLFSEDEMIKRHLSGISVPSRDADDPKVPVGVWFRWPEGERQIKYPFITIDLLAAEPAFRLFTSEYQQPTTALYRPSVAPNVPDPPLGWSKQDYSIRNFLPFLLTYQVVHHSRTALHDRYLSSIFRSDVFAVRPFWIWNDADETWRRTELMQCNGSDLSETTESGTKRIFRKIYTIQTMAEVPQDRFLDSVGYKVLRSFIPVVDLAWFDTYRQEILDGHADPTDEFSTEERGAQGEYLYVAHSGTEVPAPT